MEKKEELLERLVNEIAAQNKLAAMQIVLSIGIPNKDLMSKQTLLTKINKEAKIILSLVYKESIE